MAYSPHALIAPAFLRQRGEVVSANERDILRLIRRHKGIARSELSARSALTQQSVYRIVDALIERGLLIAGPRNPAQGRGQPSPMLFFRPDYAFSVGLSVNTDSMGLCLVDFAGDILAERQISLVDTSMERALDHAETTIDALLAELKLDPARCFGTGFAIAGYRVSGTRYNTPLPLHEWALIELGPMLHDRLGTPTWVHNGANTGAIAEAVFGVGRHIRHFAYLSFNYGFGGGLISDGELLLGGHGNAGEFSGMFDEVEKQNRPALQYLIAELAGHGVHVPSIAHMREHFDPKWPGVAEWLDRVAPMQTRLINAIGAVFDPQAIVFGGQVPPALAAMLIERSYYYAEIPRYGVSPARAKLIASDITRDASAMGAAIVPFQAEFF